MKVLPDLFRGRIVPGALLGLYMILTPLSTPASESDMHKITENLPWDFGCERYRYDNHRIRV